MNNEENQLNIQIKEEEGEDMKLVKKLNITIKYNKLFFFLYTLCFIIVLFSQVDISNYQDSVRSLKRYLFDKESKENIKYLDTPKIYNLFKELLDKIINEVPFEINNRFTILSNVRLTQRKVKLVKDENPNFITDTDILNWAAQSIDPYSDFDPLIETQNQIFDKSEKRISFLNNGGYVKHFNISTFLNEYTQLSKNPEVYNTTRINEIKNLFFLEFVDYLDVSRVASLTIDFMLANYDLQYICPVILNFAFTNVGQASLTFNMFFLDKDIYSTSGKMFRAGLEIIFILMLVIYLISFFYKIKIETDLQYCKIAEEIDKKRLKLRSSLTNKKNKTPEMKLSQKNNFLNIEDRTQRSHIRLMPSGLELEREIDKENKNDYIENIDKNVKSIPEQDLTYPNKFILFFKVMLNDKFNIIHLLSSFFTIICIYQWLIYISSMILHQKQMEDLFLTDAGVIPFDLHNDLISSGIAYDVYINYAAINFLFIFIRAARFIIESIEDTKLFLNSLIYAGEDLISFFLLFSVFFSATTFFSFLYYTKFSPHIKNLFSTVELNMTFVIGGIDDKVAKDLFNFSPWITIMYLVIVIMFIKFVLLKILLSILLFYYNVAYDEYNSSNRDVNLLLMTEEKMKKVTHRNWLWQLLIYYLDFVKYVWSILCCERKQKKLNNEHNHNHDNKNQSKYDVVSDSSKNKKKSIINLIQDHKIKTSSFSLPKDFVEFNTTYDKNDAVICKRKTYFESEKDSQKLSEYYEKKYKKTFIFFIFYIIFVFIFSYNSLFNTLVPWLELSKSAGHHKFNDYPKETDSQKFFNIKSSSNLRNFIYKSSNFMSLFSILNNGIYFLDINSVLFDTNILTVRRSINNPKYPHSDNVRKYQTINLDGDLEYENKTNFKIDGEEIKFSKHESYRNLGGYPLVINLNTLPSITNKNSTFFDQFIDDYTVVVYIEFFLDNMEYNVISYFLLTCTLDFGGNYNTNLLSDLIHVQLINSRYDYVKFIFEIIFCILFLFLIINFMREIYIENKLYDKWKTETVDSLSDKTREYRDKTMPEVFRKVFSLINLDRVSEIALLGFCGILVYLRIEILSFQFKNISADGYKYLKDHNINFFEFRKMMYDAMDNINHYSSILTIILIIMSVRVIKLLSLGKYFRILIDSLSNAYKYNNIFLSIIVLIQPAFVCYSNLAFGKNIKSFSTWSLSLVSCINILLGEFNFEDYYQSNPYLGPIFFFIYLILFNMVLLNLFSAIIDRSYRNVKEIVIHLDEKYELKRVYFFCCIKKKNLVTDVFVPIDRLFDYSHNLHFSNYHFIKPIITSKYVHPKEWTEQEVFQFKTIDDAIMNSQLRSRKVNLAYLSKDIGQTSLFDESNLKGVEAKHIKISCVLENLMLVDVADKLYKDILIGEKYNHHLEEYSQTQNYKNKAEELEKTNEENLEKVAQLEKIFIKSYEDFEELKSIYLTLDSLEDDIMKEILLIEKDADKIFKRHETHK